MTPDARKRPRARKLHGSWMSKVSCILSVCITRWHTIQASHALGSSRVRQVIREEQHQSKLEPPSFQVNRLYKNNSNYTTPQKPWTLNDFHGFQLCISTSSKPSAWYSPTSNSKLPRIVGTNPWRLPKSKRRSHRSESDYYHSWLWRLLSSQNSMVAYPSRVDGQGHMFVLAGSH